MTRAVVDPSVFVSAFLAGLTPVPAGWSEQRFTLVVSRLLLEELAGVLGRPMFERWASNGRATSYVAGITARSEHRPNPAAAQPSVRDPDDDYLVALARAEKVDVLVSLTAICSTRDSATSWSRTRRPSSRDSPDRTAETLAQRSRRRWETCGLILRLSGRSNDACGRLMILVPPHRRRDAVAAAIIAVGVCALLCERFVELAEGEGEVDAA